MINEARASHHAPVSSGSTDSIMLNGGHWLHRPLSQVERYALLVLVALLTITAALFLTSMRAEASTDTASLAEASMPVAIDIDPTLVGLDQARESAIDLIATAEAALPEEVAPEPVAAQEIGEGEASYYADRFAGRRTASGETFDPSDFTAAHRTLPMGSKVRVTNIRSGKSVVVRINDRGPFHGNRVIDLSKAAAREIGMIQRGKAQVALALIL